MPALVSDEIALNKIPSLMLESEVQPCLFWFVGYDMTRENEMLTCLWHVCVCRNVKKCIYKLILYSFKTYISSSLFTLGNGVSGKRHWDSGQLPNIPSYAIAVSIVFCFTKGWLHITLSIKPSSIATGCERYVLLLLVAHNWFPVLMTGWMHHWFISETLHCFNVDTVAGVCWAQLYSELVYSIVLNVVNECLISRITFS